MRSRMGWSKATGATLAATAIAASWLIVPGSEAVTVDTVHGREMGSDEPEVDPPALPREPIIPVVSARVSEYGAIPDDGQDDTSAIQLAIDEMAGSSGGTLLFEPGQYDISIDPDTQSRARGPIAIELRSKVRLKAERPRQSILRLADHQYYTVPGREGWNYWALFNTDPGVQTNDVVLDGLVIDSNSQNQREQNGGFGGQTIRIFGGERILITNCQFTNQINNQVVSFNANDPSTHDGAFISDAQVVDSLFDNIGGQKEDNDHSTIYTRGDRMRVSNNTLRSIHGAGTNSVHTGIETHNNDQTVTGNTIDGYWKGMNITGAAPGGRSNRQLVEGNVMTDVSAGIMLWSTDGNADPEMSGLENIAIRDNTITLNIDDWNESDLTAVAAGIISHGFQTPLPMRTISITGNTIEFTNFDNVAHEPTFTRDSIAGGIVFRWDDTRQDAPTRIEDLYVAGNYVKNTLSAGIWSDVSIHGGTISENRIVRPGRNGDLEKDYGSGQVSWHDDFRSGMYISSNVDQTDTVSLIVSSNLVQATPRRAPLVEYGIVAVSECVSTCVVSNNRVVPGNMTEVKAGPGWAVE